MVRAAMRSPLIYVTLLLAVLIAACGGENEYREPDTFSFVVYPGSRYLGELTEITRQAHRLVNPNQDPPPVAIYDTDASVEEVATFYAKSYGYGRVASEPPKSLDASPAGAWYRTGDLASDTGAIKEQLAKLGLNTDVSKAHGSYQAAEITGRPNRPRVTVQRPYFNVKTSEVVDRTIILMAR